MKTLFILLHIPDPRMNKRIAHAKELGSCSVLAFRKNNFNVWEPAHKDVEHHIVELDIPSAHNPIGRIKLLPELRDVILKELNEKNPSCVYISGLDVLSIVSIYKKQHPSVTVVYEVADLSSLQLNESNSIVKRWLSRVIRCTEKSLQSTVDILVLTSPKFYDVYYSKFFPQEKVRIVLNIPDFGPFKDYRRKVSGVFTVGFIGGIRYINQLKMLADVSYKLGIRVIFAGGAATDEELEKFKSYCSRYTDIQIIGKYNYNTEIASLYSSIDCVYAVYDASLSNVRIALPNKLYESVYCGIPIIVAKDTYLSQVVNEWGVGLAVDCNDSRELADTLLSIREDNDLVLQFQESMKNVSQDLQNDDSLVKLFKELNRITAERSS